MSNVQVGDFLDGRYRVDAQIAKGGMSTVFRCEDTRLGRQVAVKVMDDRYLGDAIFRSRFEREARSMAQLHHPNVVDVFDFNSTGNHAYLVMELINGGTLRELLAERGPMPPHAATTVMRGLLTGLAVAHKQGLVHRDIKPDNVLINSDHRVKLTDFGLVRAVAESERTTDQIVGTVSYLSPEQVDGGHIGPESDVYSAGVLLFELLTGTTPFAGDSQLSHAMQRLHQDVPAPSSRIDGVPALFDELVAAATHRDPAERFPTAAEFLAALEDVATELELPSFKIPIPTNSAVARATEVVTPLAAPQREPRTYQQPAQSTAILPAASPAPAPSTAAFPVPVESPPPVVAVDPPKPVSNRSPIKLIAWWLVVLLLIGSVAIGGWWFGSGRYGEVPQILGLDKVSAVQDISEAGFAPTVLEVFSDDVPVGKAVGTTPPFGSRVPRSDKVVVLISKGQPTVPAIPANGDVGQFRTAIEERQLKLEFGEEVYSDNTPVGGIAQVSPASGVTVKIGSTVTASISKGPAPVEVPEVAGLSEADATRLLQEAGFTVRGVERAFSDKHPAGVVITSQPGAHSKLSRGSEVQLKVSNALEVPDVVGKDPQVVRAELEAAGFVVTVAESSKSGDFANQIVEVSPKPGTLISPDNPHLTLTVATEIKVPSVIGMTVKDATKVLEDAGLEVEAKRSGKTVLLQSPRAGSRVKAGETITLTTIN